MINYPLKRAATRGFTLIEMVCTIVVLSILAVTAASAYVSFRKDAKIAALMGAKDAFATISIQVYTKALLQGETEVIASQRANIDLDNDGTNDIQGYYGLIRTVGSANEWGGLDEGFNVRTWYGASSPTEPYFLIGYGDETLSQHNLCYVEIYYPNDSSGEINYNLVSEDC
ncbi:type II secretion system protein [Vibrio rhodolitus]|uniref:type II secretion system protein n=1 Tax=Vibrio rhodolitus TaxID=2231649 RepID=UPI0013E0B1DA|nr:type II secretion system protein [Vibrio rhodolitus]